tara:strand:- start:256 stop:528 length:273 start_codon:yes stop_codon:yes gene_type:complete
MSLSLCSAAEELVENFARRREVREDAFVARIVLSRITLDWVEIPDRFFHLLVKHREHVPRRQLWPYTSPVGFRVFDKFKPTLAITGAPAL